MRFNGRYIRSSYSRQLMLRQTCRMVMFFLVVCTCLFRDKNSNRRLVERRFREAVDACQSFSRPLGVSNDAPYATQILEVLLTIDHVFVLSFDACETKLPRALPGEQLVVGAMIDACAPIEFIRGPYKHAMKVSFLHAAVLYLAEKANFRHVALIEDDVVVRHGILSEDMLPDFGKILSSKTWSMIRFGFRPYFLEQNSREPCPHRCRCYIKQKFAHELRFETRAATCAIRFLRHSPDAIRTLIVKAFGYQTSEFEANYR